MKRCLIAAMILMTGYLPLCHAASGHVSVISTNGFSVAINATNSVQILPARTSVGDRVSLMIRDYTSNAVFFVEFGAAATTNSIPVKAGEVFQESLPVIDNRTVNVLGTTISKVHVQEKLE